MFRVQPIFAYCLILFLTAACRDDRIASNCRRVAARRLDGVAFPAVCSLML